MAQDSTRSSVIIIIVVITLAIKGCYGIAGWILLDRYNKKFDEEIKNNK